MRRRSCLWLVSVFGAIVLAIAWIFASRHVSGGSPILRGVIGGVIPFVPHFIVQVRLTREMRRWRRAFAESGGRLCTGCAHNLAGLQDRGACPECGGGFDVELDREAWRAAGIVLPAEPLA